MEKILAQRSLDERHLLAEAGLGTLRHSFGLRSGIIRFYTIIARALICLGIAALLLQAALLLHLLGSVHASASPLLILGGDLLLLSSILLAQRRLLSARSLRLLLGEHGLLQRERRLQHWQCTALRWKEIGIIYTGQLSGTCEIIGRHGQRLALSDYERLDELLDLLKAEPQIRPGVWRSSEEDETETEMETRTKTKTEMEMETKTETKTKTRAETPAASLEAHGEPLPPSGG
jgi:hypothetical protein